MLEWFKGFLKKDEDDDIFCCEMFMTENYLWDVEKLYSKDSRGRFVKGNKMHIFLDREKGRFKRKE